MASLRIGSSLIVLGLAAFSASPAAAEVIVSYDFNDGFNSAEDPAAESVAANITSVWSGDAGIQNPQVLSGVSWFGYNSWGTAFSDSEAMVLTLTIADGYQLDLNSLSFDAAGDPQHDYELTLVIGSDETVVASANDINPTFGGPITQGPVDLSSFTALTGTIIFEYRIARDAGTFGSVLGIDDVVLDGTVTLIPEPGALALMGLGGVMLLSRRQA